MSWPRLFNTDSSINVDYIKVQPASDHFKVIAMCWHHLLQRSKGQIPRIEAYPLTNDFSSITLLLDLQVTPLSWLMEPVRLLDEMIKFAYNGRNGQIIRHHRQGYVPEGTTSQQQYIAIFNISQEGQGLWDEFYAHHKEFSDFVLNTAGGQSNCANFLQSHPTDGQLLLSNSYQQRIEANLAFSERVEAYRDRLERVLVYLLPMPDAANLQTPEEKITLDRHYYTNGRTVSIVRYPGLPPHRWYNFNVLVEQKFSLLKDVLGLGGNGWDYEICYFA